MPEEQPVETAGSADSVKTLEEAEKKRVLAEADAHIANRRKLDLEAAEIESRLQRRWYEGRFFLEVSVGAVVASALVAAWLITYMEPMLSKEHELAKLEGQILAKKNLQQQAQNEDRTRQLIAENQQTKARLRQISAQNASLQAQQAEAEKRTVELQQRIAAKQDEIDRLSQRAELSIQDRRSLAEYSESLRVETDRLEKEVAFLREQQRVSETLAQQIRKSVSIANLRDTEWEQTCDECSAGPPIHIFLRGDGVAQYRVPDVFDDHIIDQDDGSWSIEGSKLILTWSETEMETYTFEGQDLSRAVGESTLFPGLEIFMERI